MLIIFQIRFARRLTLITIISNIVFDDSISMILVVGIEIYFFARLAVMSQMIVHVIFRLIGTILMVSI